MHRVCRGSPSDAGQELKLIGLGWIIRKARVPLPTRVTDGGRQTQLAKVDCGAHPDSRTELRRQGGDIGLRGAEGRTALEERSDSSPYQRGGHAPLEHYGKFPGIRGGEVVSGAYGGAARGKCRIGA